MLSLRRDNGWVLMDAVMSSVVVVLAFTATFYALDASSKTASRDIKRTTALVVAQNELDKMRNDLTQDITVLDELENSSSSVTYQGTNYSVTRRAYYVTGLGGDQTTACGKKFDGTAGGTAKFIYLKVSVAHNGSTSTAESNPGATLDAYYAPEGGSTQTGTATLRIYVLDRNGIEVNPGTQQVQLYLDGVYQDQQIANENGCVLFIGLERGAYEVRIPNTKYEIHMERKPTNAAIVNVPINVPQRAALSKDVRIETPVTVTPTFVTNNGSADVAVNPSNASSHVGPWVAVSEKITRESGTDFTTLPGSVHLPHASPLPANQIYPDPSGYGAYAGACDINDPDDGNVGNGSERASFPLPGTEGTWVPGGTYTAGSPLWLSQIRARAYANSGGNGFGYRNEAVVANSVQVAVKLVADPGAEKIGAKCGSRLSSHYDRYVRLPGVTSHNGYLSDDAESLPAGRYNVCVRIRLYYQYLSFIWWNSTEQTRYMSISNQDLFYRSAISPTFNFSDFDSSSTSDCASGQVSWS